MDNIRKFRKDNMLCVQCGNPLDREGYYCNSCNKKWNEYKNEHARENVKNGKCSNCGTPLDRVGWFCTKCTERLRTRANIRSAERRLNHQCVQCGEPNIDGSYCDRCRAMRMARYHKRKGRGSKK